MRIGVVPLDERPVNTRYPAMIGAIAGVEVLLPPPDALPNIREPARSPVLAAWLDDVASRLDALIVSCELLGYGGLVASRLSDEPASTIIARLEQLRAIKRQHPSLPIYGFNLITRVSNANHAWEEPAYWNAWGTRMYRLSQLLDQDAQGAPVADDLAALRADIPPAHTHDFLKRRLRNHTVNLAVLHLLLDGVLDLLVLSSDDTSPYGLPSREKRWLSTWAAQLDLHADQGNVNPKSKHPEDTRNPHFLMYPGADEVGCVLLARLINEARGWTPRIRVEYAVPGGETVVAPYEDGPVHVTVERQVRAVGGIVVDGEADLLLAVNPPVPNRREWQPSFAPGDAAARWPYLDAFVEQIRRREAAEQPIIVADVAYPNGADPLLVDLLRQRVWLVGLSAYGGWNTAGNTIGTALAQGCALAAGPSVSFHAHTEFLLHRLLEDWGYQQRVRQQARAWLRANWGTDEPRLEHVAATERWIEEQLNALLPVLSMFAPDWEVGNVRLPWQRLFEVDFDLDRRIPASGRVYTLHRRPVTPGAMSSDEEA